MPYTANELNTDEGHGYILIAIAEALKLLSKLVRIVPNHVVNHT
mgnify:CR=1 FL=1